jgi:hypothetical protein
MTYNNITTSEFDSFGRWRPGDSSSTADVIYSFKPSEGDKIDVRDMISDIFGNQAKNTGTFLSTLIDASGSSSTTTLGTFWLGSDSYLYGNLIGGREADFAIYLAKDDIGTAFKADELANLSKYFMAYNKNENPDGGHLIFA